MVAPTEAEGVNEQLAAAQIEERNALRMAKELDKLGAPERDVRYALDRAQAAKAKQQRLQHTPDDRDPASTKRSQV